jgi:hypothetical protein
LIEIRMRVGGDDLLFRRCPRCEAQTWLRGDDGAVPLQRVLELAGRRT